MARAYVVGWLNVISGTIEKAGIYSEPNPTPMMGDKRASIVLFETTNWCHYEDALRVAKMWVDSKTDANLPGYWSFLQRVFERGPE